MKKTSIGILLLLITMIFVTGNHRFVVADMIQSDGEGYEYYDDTILPGIFSIQKQGAVVKTDGTVLVWGSNYLSQLGDGLTATRLAPVDITSNYTLAAGEKITKIVESNEFSLALSNKNNVFYKEAGTSTLVIDITSGFTISPTDKIIDVQVGTQFLGVLSEEGKVFMWGDNSYGQVGDNTFIDKAAPVDITTNFGLSGGEKIVSLELGNDFAIALSNNNKVFTWGLNNKGQLGDSTLVNKSVPTNITSEFTLVVGETIDSVYGGEINTAAISSLGNLYTWGDNSEGQLGDDTVIPKSTPTDVSSYFGLGASEKITHISWGYYHFVVLTSANRIFTCGYNYDGQLGADDLDVHTSIVNVTSNFPLNPGEIVVTTTAGTDFSIAVTNQARVFTWGDNHSGQLGIGIVTYHRTVPTYVLMERLTITELAYVSLPTTSDILKFEIDSEILYTDSNVTFSIFPENDIYPYLQTITVNSIELDNTHFTNNGGRIDVTIPNTFDLDDVITFTLNSVKFFDDVVSVTSGENSGEVTFIDDTVPPTFDNIVDQSIEIASSDIDWTTYIINEADNSEDVLTKVEVADNIIYSTLGTYSVTVKLMDDSSNETSQTFDVTVEDTTGPTFDAILYQYIEPGVDLDQDWTTYMDNLTDNSGGTIVTSEDDTVMYDVEGTYTVTVTATDPSGNETTQTFDVEVFDSLGPDLTYTGELTYEINSVKPDFDTLFDAIDAFDGDVSFNLNVVDNTDFSTLGSYIVSAEVSDTHTNNEYVEITVEIVDTEAPTFDNIPYQYIEPGVDLDQDWTTYMENLTDNSGGTIVTSEDDTVMYDTEGTYSVTVTATDPSGNETTQSFDVEVFDSLAPDLTYTGELIYEINSVKPDFDTLFDAIDAFDGDVSFNLIVVDNTDFSEIGAYIVSAEVSDTHTNYEYMEITINIVDTTGPTFDTIPYQYIEPGVDLDQDWTTYMENLTDNSEGTIVTSEDDTVMYDIEGTYTVTVTATDPSGNETTQSFEVEVFDSLAPDLTYNGELTYEINSVKPDFDTLFDAIDAFDGDVSFNLNVVDNTDFTEVGSYIVSAEVSDTHINYEYMEVTINIVDTIGPTFDDIPLQYIEYWFDSDKDWTTIVTGVLDNSLGLVTLREVDNVNYDVIGNYTVTIVATDPAGNQTSKTFDVEVQDTTGPAILYAGELIYEINSLEPDFVLLFEAFDAYFVDDYGTIDDFSDSIEVLGSVDFSTLGSYVITATAFDEYQNSSSREVTIDIIDTIAPTFDDIEDQVVEVFTLDIDFTALIFGEEDNSLGELTKIEVYDSTDYSTVGTYQATVKVVDESLNETEFTFNVEIVDTVSPSISIDNPLDIDEDQLLPDFLSFVSGYDEYDGDISEDIIVDLILLDPNEPGVYTIEYSLTDSSGNNTSVQTSITVNDITPPVVTLNPAKDTIYVGDNYIDEEVTILDNLDLILSVVVTNNLDVNTVGVYTIVYKVVDEAGNETVITRYVNVLEKDKVVEFQLGDALTTLAIGDEYIDGICDVLVDSVSYVCTPLGNNIDTSVAGIYTVSYGYTIDGTTYTYDRYVFVYEDGVELTLYYRKEEEVYYL